MHKKNKFLGLLLLFCFTAGYAYPYAFEFFFQTRKVLFYPRKKMVRLLRTNEYATGVVLSTYSYSRRQFDDPYENRDLPHVNTWYLNDTIDAAMQLAIKRNLDVSLVIYAERIIHDPRFGKIIESNKYIFQLTPDRYKKHSLWAEVNYDAKSVDTLGFE